MLYFIWFCILMSAFVAVILLSKYMKNTKLWNSLFVLTIAVCYVALVIEIYRASGPDHWNFSNAMPMANVSPFMFFTAPFLFLLPARIRKYAYVLISGLTVGMFLSSAVGCLGNFIKGTYFRGFFVLDYIAHFALASWGVYLVKSKQVSLNIKDCVIGASALLGVATCMLLLNLVLDTAFFGLSLRGKHNIYNVVLTDNSYLSALLYYGGVVVVLSLGFGFQRLLNPKKK